MPYLINDYYGLSLLVIAASASLLILYHVTMLMIEAKRVIRLCNKMRGE